MTFWLAPVASAADLNDALASDSPTTFSTTTPAGTGWYRFLLGGHWWSSTGSRRDRRGDDERHAGLHHPGRLPPAARTAIAGVAGASSPRLADVAIDSDGTWQVYNGHSSATVINAHGTYKPA